MQSGSRHEITQPGPSIVALCLVIFYALGAVFFLSGWLGVQSIPAAWSEISMVVPLYAILCVLGGISALGILLWRRWGVYGILFTWIVITGLNIFLIQTSLLYVLGISLLALIVFGYDIRRRWIFLR